MRATLNLGLLLCAVSAAAAQGVTPNTVVFSKAGTDHNLPKTSANLLAGIPELGATGSADATSVATSILDIDSDWRLSRYDLSPLGSSLASLKKETPWSRGTPNDPEVSSFNSNVDVAEVSAVEERAGVDANATAPQEEPSAGSRRSRVPEPSTYGIAIILVLMTFIASKRFRLNAIPTERY